VADVQVGDAVVEARSAALPRELGVVDLALTQILFIVGLPWVGVAAKLGPSHVVFWLLAIALFYLPSAAVVTYLNRLMPLEGGLYQWAKLGFNDLVGFLVAWNLWLFAILNASEAGLQVTQYAGYVAPSAAAALDSRATVSIVNALLIGGLVVITARGLSVGKWVHSAGGALLIFIFAAITILPWLNVARGTVATFHPLATTAPTITVFSLNILGKMGFGALGGFEYVAIHAGECRNPVRSIARSVAVAAPIIAAMFILGTSSVLALVPGDQIDLIAPIPQVLSAGFRPFGAAGAVATLAIVALACVRVAQSSVMFAGTTRLPMVAGWDGVLPAWFTRLDARYRTPVNSIVFVGAATFALATAGLVGVGKQEAFQLLWNASAIFYALTYLVMFAIPLVGLRGRAAPPLRLRAAALSGFLMTALYVTLSILPIIDVESPLVFAAKICGLIAATNLVGAAIFLGKRGARTPWR
jgi:glutamate:GABA antiporter